MINCNEITNNLTTKFSQGVRERLESGGDLLSLGLGQPNYTVPEEVIEETISALKEGKLTYTPPLGVPELREAISGNYKKTKDIQIDKNNILVTPGVRQALIISMMCVLEPEDEVIIFSPFFSSYPAMVKIAQREAKIVEYNFDENSTNIDFDRLENMITSKTRAIVCNFPHNPTGAILDKDSYEKLSKLIIKHDLYVITDEVYERVVFAKKYYLLSQNEKLLEQMFIVTGFSKSYAMTGFRIGYIIFPEIFRKVMLKLSLHMNACTNTFIQYGAVKAFQVTDEYIENNNRNLMINRNNLINKLDKLNMTYFYPDSGYFAFVSIEQFNMESNEFCYLLAKNAGVAVTPGLACGKEWDKYVRISFAVDKEIFDEALKRIEKLILDLNN